MSAGGFHKSSAGKARDRAAAKSGNSIAGIIGFFFNLLILAVIVVGKLLIWPFSAVIKSEHKIRNIIILIIVILILLIFFG